MYYVVIVTCTTKHYKVYMPTLSQYIFRTLRVVYVQQIVLLSLYSKEWHDKWDSCRPYFISTLLTNTITTDTYNPYITYLDHFGSLGHLEIWTHVFFMSVIRVTSIHIPFEYRCPNRKNNQTMVEVWPLHTRASSYNHVIVRDIDSHPKAIPHV